MSVWPDSNKRQTKQMRSLEDALNNWNDSGWAVTYSWETILTYESNKKKKKGTTKTKKGGGMRRLVRDAWVKVVAVVETREEQT